MKNKKVLIGFFFCGKICRMKRGEKNDVICTRNVKIRGEKNKNNSTINFPSKQIKERKKKVKCLRDFFCVLCGGKEKILHSFM